MVRGEEPRAVCGRRYVAGGEEPTVARGMWEEVREEARLWQVVVRATWGRARLLASPPAKYGLRLFPTYRLPHTTIRTQMKLIAVKWFKYLIAILLGNGLYFALNPYLPQPAKHHPFKFDLGTLVDFWLCLAVYGLMELGAFLHHRGKR